MASLAVRNAVVARINSEWNGGSPRCPLSLPNEAFVPPADSGPFLSVQFPVSNEDIMELGPAPNFYREDGAIRLVLCFGINQGTDTALTWIDELRAIFRGQYFDGVITYAPSPPIEANDNDSGNYYRLSVAIPYEYDFVETVSTVAAGGYVAEAVHFDGSTQGYRTTALAGGSASFVGLMSVWFKLPVDPEIDPNFFATTTQINGDGLPDHDWGQNNLGIKFLGGFPFLSVGTDDFSGYVYAHANTDDLRDGEWHQTIFSWNTNFPLGNRVIQNITDGVARTITIEDEGGDAFQADFSTPGVVIGADGFSATAPRHAVTGDQAELFLTIGGSFIDLTNPAELLKYRTIDGKPLDLLTSGAPTGLVYINGNAAAALANADGTGGSFTTIGTLTDASTSPSD